jgi:hypothetical protein
MNGDRCAIWLMLCGLAFPQLARCQITARLHRANETPAAGQLLSFLPPTNITFRTAAGLRTNGFHALIFAPPESTNTAPAPNRLRLHDGSIISGTLRAMDPDRVTIAPPHSPPLTFPRSAVASLRWTDLAQGVRYEGPNGTSGWIVSALPGTNDTPSWILRDGLYLAQGRGTLARESGMSTVARVEFDLHWNDKPRFRLNFFSRETDQLSFSEGYVFYSPGHGTIFAMTRSSDPRQKIDIRRVDIPSLVSSNYAHLDFRLNSQKGEGWTDLGISGAGQAIVFQNFDQDTRLAIANLRVSDWDGRTSVDPPPTGKLTTIVFKNGDSVKAEQPIVSGTNITFQFNGAPLTLPTERIAQIHPPPAQQTENGPPTWIQFVRGDWIRAEILGISDSALHWRRPGTPGEILSPLLHIRGLHHGRDKPVMDLSWYFPKSAASESAK